MKLQLNITMDNAAFEADPLSEATRILRNVADRMDGGSWGGPLKDINGNTVGTFDITSD